MNKIARIAAAAPASVSRLTVRELLDLVGAQSSGERSVYLRIDVSGLTMTADLVDDVEHVARAPQPEVKPARQYQTETLFDCPYCSWPMRPSLLARHIRSKHGQ